MISKKSYCSNNTGNIQGNRVKHSVKQGHADSSKTFKTRMWVRLPRREWSVQGSTVLLIWFSYLFGCFLAFILHWSCCLTTKLCPTLCNHRDCSLPGSSVNVISQARILEWVAISFSRRYPWPTDQTCIFCIAARFFTAEPPGNITYGIMRHETNS